MMRLTISMVGTILYVKSYDQAGVVVGKRILSEMFCEVKKDIDA